MSIETKKKKKHKTLGEFVANEFSEKEKWLLYTFGTYSPEQLKERGLSEEEVNSVASGIAGVLKKLINEVDRGLGGEISKRLLEEKKKQYHLYFDETDKEIN